MTIRTLMAVRGIETTDLPARQRLILLGDRLSIDPDHISAVISHESRWNPQARNPNASASGLIQFLASTAKGLGTTIEAIRQMNAYQQLEYVERFYRPFKGRIKSPSDALMAAFWPAGVGKGDAYVIAREGSSVYEVNKAFDRSKKGWIDASDVTASIKRVVADAATRPRLVVDMSQPAPHAGEGGAAVALLLGLAWLATFPFFV